jgi:hypothetical protein
MEAVKGFWRREKGPAETFPPDLKKLILERQKLKERIKGLDMDMELAASAKDQRHVLDVPRKKEYEDEDKTLAKGIFDLCLKYEIEPIRFLSPDEISDFF